MIEHQILESKSQQEDMQMKAKLCKDIKQGNVPLVSYVADQYEEVLNHDPFRILVHLDDDRNTFYNFMNEIHQRREHMRVGIKD